MERWQQIESLFQQALERDPAERNAWLRDACHGDAELQRDVSSLLTNHQAAADSKPWAAAAAAKLIDGAASLEPGQCLGPYRIESFLAAGGMGQVYRATDTRLHRQVAIKVSSARFTERFEREARVIASLNHPNICQLYDVGSNYLVMEFADGPTLAEQIHKSALPLDDALAIARRIAEALEAAHEKGIVHRDLKPANVKVTPDGVVKVLDFGLAKAAEEQAAAATCNASDSPTQTMSATRAGVILGTAAYMSPEQARGQTVDRRMDIWAFGVVLYEMLTGRPLFAGPTISDTLATVLKMEVDVAELPTQLRPIVERCLRKDPRRRWQAIGDVRVALEEGVTVVQVKDLQRSRLPWALGGALGLALAALSTISVIHFRETSVQPATVRFPMLPPEGASFGADLALSPDGRRLAFMASPKGGQPLLWVRELDSLEARPLRGTEFARRPFWSPDSHSLAFSTGMTLKKVEASGGPVQTLCNSSNIIAGGDWIPDGLVYFGTVGGVIYRVPQAGGEAVTVTKPDPTRAEDLEYPQILPDGRHLLYLSAPLGGGNAGIYLASLDGKEKKRLVAARTSFRYAPPSGSGTFGHLLFLRDNTLTAQPLDPKSFELRGDAFPVAEGIGYAQTYGYFTISANGALAYRSGVFGEETQLTWFDRAGKPLGVLGSRARYNNIALSPDAARAAVVERDRNTLNNDLWLFDLARGIPTQFTFHEAQDWDPVWSPDGSRVAFSSNRDGPYNLYVKDSTGGRPEERLHKNDIAESERPCDWSPDGRFLMYTRGLRLSFVSLWVLSDPAGDPANRKAAPYLETPFVTAQCQFSPDSHWVAYSSNESNNRSEVYVQSFPAPSIRTRVSSNGGVQPRWRRDGKELFYIAGDDKLMAVDVRTVPTFKAEVPHALFDPHVFGGSGVNFVFRYDVSPDGGRFLVNSAVQFESRAPDPITVVLNWTAGLKK